MNNNKLSTTNINSEHLKILKKLCGRHQLKQVEFINASMEYFLHSGINPTDKIYSAREEVSKLTLRVEQVIKFMVQHEKTKLSPLFERLLLLESKMIDTFSNAITSKDTDSINIKISELNSKFIQTQQHVEKLTPNTLVIIRKAIESIQLKQEKTELLISLLFEALNNKSITGTFRDTDIKNFEDALHKI